MDLNELLIKAHKLLDEATTADGMGDTERAKKELSELDDLLRVQDFSTKDEPQIQETEKPAKPEQATEV